MALDTSVPLEKGSLLALIAAPKGKLDPSKITVDPSDMKLQYEGKALEYGYCVISIRPAVQKPDFGEIPELKERYAAVQRAIRENKAKDAQEALTAFRLATIASPDLIAADAKRLVGLATALAEQAFPAGGISTTKEARFVEPLSTLRLYH